MRSLVRGTFAMAACSPYMILRLEDIHLNDLNDMHKRGINMGLKH